MEPFKKTADSEAKVEWPFRLISGGSGEGKGPKELISGRGSGRKAIEKGVDTGGRGMTHHLATTERFPFHDLGFVRETWETDAHVITWGVENVFGGLGGEGMEEAICSGERGV